MADANAGSPNVDVLIRDKEIKGEEFISFVIERDMFQPDMATITLSNQNDIFSGVHAVGTPIEVRIGPGKSIFKGEIIGFEGHYKGGDTTRLTIRAANRMHRLLRVRTSKAFVDKNDQQIIDELCKKAGLKLEFEHKKPVTYKEIYQHNLNGLEFARTRAARIGCYMWCVDTTLFVKEPDFSKVGGVKLSVDQGGNLRTFTPRLSSASIAKKVIVKSWDPEAKRRSSARRSSRNRRSHPRIASMLAASSRRTRRSRSTFRAGPRKRQMSSLQLACASSTCSTSPAKPRCMAATRSTSVR